MVVEREVLRAVEVEMEEVLVVLEVGEVSEAVCRGRATMSCRCICWDDRLTASWVQVGGARMV